jgi:putative ABC transport system ATP-binding protein
LLRFLQSAVRQFEQTIVMVTHDPSAAAFADRVVFLEDGRIVEDLSSPSVDAILGVMKTLVA